MPDGSSAFFGGVLVALALVGGGHIVLPNSVWGRRAAVVLMGGVVMWGVSLALYDPIRTLLGSFGVGAIAAMVVCFIIASRVDPA